MFEPEGLPPFPLSGSSPLEQERVNAKARAKVAANIV
jgi:hypothetical protein